jgi:pimeloyl-ACP methyl ester carboxylesterase
MTRVFVHGVPETTRIWDGLRAELGEESVALALPGFGNPRPAGFRATMDEYAGWLLGGLERLDAPIDLVGHDWGGILTVRTATTAGDRLRSWITDTVMAVDPSFGWHDLAKIWQTPGEGEKFWDDVRAAPDDSAVLFTSLGVPERDAAEMIAACDDTMVGCILDLYRSAVNIGHDWQSEGRAGATGMLLVGGDDPYGALDRARPVAERLGADVQVLDGLGHFWPAQGPAAGATAIRAFWAGLSD